MQLHPESTDSSTLALLARIQAGEREAWEELHDRYRDDLLRTVRQHLGPGLRGALESEDILQSVALESLRALPGFEHRGSGSLLRYLRGMVVNKIRYRARFFAARRRERTVSFDEARVAPSSAGASGLALDRCVRLRRCLARLPEEMAQVLVLRRVEGLSSKEVATRLGKSDASVRKLLSRALARLSVAMLDSEPRRGTR